MRNEPNEQDIQELNMVIAARGYLVIRSNTKYAIGDRITGWNHRGRARSNHPLTVIALTDRQDLLDQIKIWGGVSKRSPKYYYRCITD